jgi:predicted O-methyltransferase YrrM
MLPDGQLASRRHRTPQYIYHRTRQLFYERGNPGNPWLTPDAVRLLGGMLRASDQGIEFGSGRSTLWFAERVAQLTSVEHDALWHRAVSQDLRARGLTNVDYVLAPWDPDEPGQDSDYVGTLRRFPESGIDFALIDGAYRDHAARLAMPRIKPGGLLIIDNVNWFLPSYSRAPASRSWAQGPDERWIDIAQDLSNWRSIWTASGVWDTAIFVRPGEASHE